MSLKSIFKSVGLWLGAAVLLLLIATPALSTILAPAGSVNTKAIIKNAVTSAKIKNGTVKNADIAAGAAIAAVKINRVGLNADLLDGRHAADFVAKASPAWATQTRKYSVPPAVWNAQLGDDLIVRSPLGAYTSTLSEWVMTAPVNLPDGAVIKRVDLYYNDTASSTSDDLYLEFFRRDLGTGAITTITTRASNAGLGRGINGADIVPAVTVDNGANIYYLHASHTGSTRQVEAVVITYTISGP